MRRALCVCVLVAAAAFAVAASTTQAPAAGPGGVGPAPAAAPGAPPPRSPGPQRFDTPEPGALSPRNASYDIEVRLDHEKRTLTGRQTIRWRNISAQPASELQLHLYWNAWRNVDSTWLRERRLSPAYTRPRDDAFGSIDVRAIRLGTPEGGYEDAMPRLRFIAPDDGNTADRTVMAVGTSAPVAPGESVAVEIEWTSKIPRTFARTGYIDDYYFIAHWFPKMGVLEDGGWKTHQFHSVSEFYADFGVYEVDIIVPAGFVVGASGRERRRIVNADGTTTFGFRGEDIHDFAWTASPRFVESRQTFEHPSLEPPPGQAAYRVEMRLLLQPEHAGQEERHFAATAATLKSFGEWFGPYPYDHLTIVDPAYQSGSGGMEYPTLFTAGTRWLAPDEVTTPEAVTVHEAGHQFWHTVVATNEFEHAWMDEGMTTFGTARVLEAMEHPNRLGLRFFGGLLPWVIDDIRLDRETDGNRLPTYRTGATGDVPSTPTYRYHPATATAITYDKTALWLNTLERHLGWPTLQKIMATYFERWKFRHPRPDDFFTVANEVSGQDLTWFFDQVHLSSNTFDYAVQDLISDPAGGRHRTIVVAQRLGEATFPVEVVTTFEDGEQVTERWNGVDRRVTFTYDRAARARSVEIDPRRVLLLDVNYTNNSRTLEPRTAEAGRKWSLRWMLWLQDLMLTYAFFV